MFQMIHDVTVNVKTLLLFSERRHYGKPLFLQLAVIVVPSISSRNVSGGNTCRHSADEVLKVTVDGVLSTGAINHSLS